MRCLRRADQGGLGHVEGNARRLLGSILACAAVTVSMLGGDLVEAEGQRRRLRRELEIQRLAAARAEGEMEAARLIQLGILPKPESLGQPDRLDAHAQIGATDPTMGAEALGNPLGDLHRERAADAAPKVPTVDADDATLGVDEWAAGETHGIR